MNILWETLSFLFIPFVRLSIRPKIHRYVIAIAVSTLLFAHCIAHHSTTDKLNDNVDASHKKWLNKNNGYVASASVTDAKVVIAKRQTPTKISNSSSSIRMNSGISYHSTNAPTQQYHDSTPLSTTFNENGIASTFTATRLTTISTTTTTKSSTADINNVLILIETQHKNIQQNLVRVQFQQFTNKSGAKLANIKIDFDIIDGKCVNFVASFT